MFQVNVGNERRKAVLHEQLRRDQVGPLFTNLPACLVDIEACASAHHWACTLQALGQTVELTAPQFVKRYVKSYVCAYARGVFDKIPTMVCDFRAGRAAFHPAAFLGGRSGTIICDDCGGYDGYDGYGGVFKSEDRVDSGRVGFGPP